MADLRQHEIRRSDRARRVRVTVEGDGRVVVTLPRRARDSDADAAVRQLAPWIERQVAKAEARRARMAGTPGTVPYLGTELHVLGVPGRRQVARRGDVLLVPDSDRAAAVERWYRRQAKAELAPRVALASAAVQRPVTRITVRNQRTRWGSCSTAGALSFNWRLLLAPEPVLDYVVWHEACHLVHMDHSPRFWRLLEQLVPGYREPQRWLQRNGGALVLPEDL